MIGSLISALLFSTAAYLGPTHAPEKLPDYTHLCIGHGPLGSKAIALTFDDGPNPDTTPDILRVLAKYNAKATFFLIGRRVKLYPNLVQQIAREGHEIGNHSYSHANLIKLTKDEAYTEYADCSAAIKAVVGFAPIVCRPPGGDANKLVVNLAGALGMRTVAWSLNVADFDLQDADAIQDKVVKVAQSGEIVELHDKVYGTIMCLDDIIAALQKQGYHFVTVSQLMEDQIDEDNAPFVPKSWLK
jgi:peptidoglycan/xylan/chitin deacetylase (PgdA/CDA1 family)